MSKVISGNLPVPRKRVIELLELRVKALQAKASQHKRDKARLEKAYAGNVAAALERAAAAARKGRLPKVRYDGSVEVAVRGKPPQDPYSHELQRTVRELALVKASNKQTISMDPGEYDLLVRGYK